MKITWEYVGEELALFWQSPYGNGKEKIASFWWPLHPPENTKDIESAFESIAAFACLWGNIQPSRCICHPLIAGSHSAVCPESAPAEQNRVCKESLPTAPVEQNRTVADFATVAPAEPEREWAVIYEQEIAGLGWRELCNPPTAGWRDESSADWLVRQLNNPHADLSYRSIRKVWRTKAGEWQDAEAGK